MNMRRWRNEVGRLVNSFIFTLGFVTAIATGICVLAPSPAAAISDPGSATFTWKAQNGAGCADAVIIGTIKHQDTGQTETETFTCNGYSRDKKTMYLDGTHGPTGPCATHRDNDKISVDNYHGATTGYYTDPAYDPGGIVPSPFCVTPLPGTNVSFTNTYDAVTGGNTPTAHGKWIPSPGATCSDSNDEVDAVFQYTYADGHTETFTCLFIGDGTAAMTLIGTIGPSQDCPANLGDHIQIDDFRGDIHGNYFSQTEPIAGFCKDAIVGDTFPITNHYADVTTKPSDLVGEATWTGTDPGQLDAIFTAPLGDHPISPCGGGEHGTCTGETFAQSSISGNVMTLSGDKTIQQCPNDVITVGDDSKDISYQDAVYAAVTVYDSPSYQGTTLTCQNHTAHMSLSSSFATATGAPTGTTGAADVQCPLTSTSGLAWLLCPVFFLGQGMVKALNSQIQNLLYINTGQIFNDSFQQGYNSIRDIAIGLVVIAALIMVVSQAAGLEMFSAYTTRKALPRMVAAAIFMALAWPILQFVVTFTNDIGTWISSIIIAAVQPSGASGTSGASYNLIGSGIVDLVIGGGVGVGLPLLIFGPIGLLSFLGTFIIALLIGYLVLTIRQIVIIVAVLLAPLAIAASILPGTERLWKFWRETLTTTLMMFPIIMAFLASGAALSVIAGNAATASQGGGPGGSGTTPLEILSIAAYFVPYFAIPAAFQMAGGLMSSVFGMVNNQGKGVFQGLSRYRQGEREYLHQQRMQGKDGLMERRIGNTSLGGIYRRLNTRGGITFTRGQNQRFIQGQRKALNLAAEETLKNDAGFAANNDDANEIAAQRGVTRQSFINDYMARTGSTNQQAAEALSMLETSYGAPIGSTGMRLAAFKAATRSGTSYRGLSYGRAGTPTDMDDDLRIMLRDANALVNDGLMSADEATQAIKFNANAGARRDRSAISYGALRGAIVAPPADVQPLRASAWEGAKPGELIMGRPEAITALAAQAAQEVSAAVAGGNQEEIDDALANVDAVYNTLKSTNPGNAEIWAHNVMSQGIMAAPGSPWLGLPPTSNPMTGQRIDQVRTIRQLIEDARKRPPTPEGTQTFLDRSREYTNQYQAQAAGGPPPTP